MEVERAAHPDRASGLENSMAFGHPFLGEFEILLPSLALVPITLVDAHHSAGVAGDAPI